MATTILATLPLFATGLGGLGALGGRRKRKATLREINGIAIWEHHNMVNFIPWSRPFFFIFSIFNCETGGPFASANAMRIPDYIALGVLIVLIVWAVADWFSQGIPDVLRLLAVGRTSLRSDLIRAAQFAIGEELRTEFQTPHELPSELRTRMEELAVRYG
jgi:hypothetical protein